MTNATTPSTRAKTRPSLPSLLGLGVLAALTACGPDLNLEGLGDPLTQTEISQEIIGKQIVMQGMSFQRRHIMTLQEDGVIRVLHPEDSGVWFLSDDPRDLCMRLALHAAGDLSCFGIDRLPEPGHYITDHGVLIVLRGGQPVAQE